MERPRPGQDNLLLIAARAPVSGATKTRLGATIGMARAAQLYRAFLTDLAIRFTPDASDDHEDGYDLGWAFTPADCDFAGVITRLDKSRRLDRAIYVPQVGTGWGERQTNLLRWGYANGYARTVLIASDSPQLARDIPDRAFAALRDHDVAFGRVQDGGYYLIGLSGFHDVLSGVPMSTSSAADALAARAASLKLRVAELPATIDVDEEADLASLNWLLAPDGAAAPATWAALRALGLATATCTSRKPQ